jgi:hypothetical protein
VLTTRALTRRVPGSISFASHKSGSPFNSRVRTLCFLDAYSGYHQIAMCVVDQLATSFITPFGAYYYQTMPFGLKNAGATFQRYMRRVFGELLGRMIEVYIDVIIVKLKKTGDLVPDLTEVFTKLRQHGVKLNPRSAFSWFRGACSSALSC